MCYFTKRVLNKRFLPNRKNRWNPPVCTDERFRYVEVECGHCFECRKKKRREWRIRNYEQLKETPHAVFFTGTVSPQRYEYICKRYGFKNDGSQDNEIITKIHRLFLERIRKVIKIRENLENKKIYIPLQCSKKQKVLTVSRETLKTKKLWTLRKLQTNFA